MFIGIFTRDGSLMEMGEIIEQFENGDVTYKPVKTDDVLFFETKYEENSYLYYGSEKTPKKINVRNLKSDGYTVEVTRDCEELCRCLFENAFVANKKVSPKLDNDKLWLLEYSA